MKKIIDLPNTIPASTGRPYGELKDTTTIGGNDGTPVRMDWMNDIYYALLSVMKRANIEPDNSEEQVDAGSGSQFADAVSNLIDAVLDLRSSETIDLATYKSSLVVLAAGSINIEFNNVLPLGKKLLIRNFGNVKLFVHINNMIINLNPLIDIEFVSDGVNMLQLLQTTHPNHAIQTFHNISTQSKTINFEERFNAAPGTQYIDTWNDGAPSDPDDPSFANTLTAADGDFTGKTIIIDVSGDEIPAHEFLPNNFYFFHTDSIQMVVESSTRIRFTKTPPVVANAWIEGGGVEPDPGDLRLPLDRTVSNSYNAFQTIDLFGNPQEFTVPISGEYLLNFSFKLQKPEGHFDFIFTLVLNNVDEQNLLEVNYSVLGSLPVPGNTHSTSATQRFKRGDVIDIKLNRRLVFKTAVFKESPVHFSISRIS